MSNQEDTIIVHATGLTEGIRCAMCKNPIRSDRGCDGGCMVDTELLEKVLKVIEQNIVR